MLDRKKHEIVLKKILADIFLEKKLQTLLAFKGGTCLYFFHSLDRFSTDLDFNLLKKDFDPSDLDKILKKHLNIDDFAAKENTYLWMGGFEKGKQKIKVEISKRDFNDKYENRDFYGFTVCTMTKDCMFAHKLCAITDRNKIQNRDLYDSLFMFEKGFDIDEEIIKKRTGKSLKNYFIYLIDFIKNNVKEKSILDGLGEVLDKKQKIYVKNNLIKKLLFELKIRV